MRNPYDMFRDAFMLFSSTAIDLTLSLNLNFMSGALPGGLTFTRASVGTDIIDGVLTSFASGTPRISTANGLLMEEARTNILQNSSVSTIAATLTGSATTGPDGVSNSATRFNSDAGTTTHGISNSVSQTHSAAAYLVSAFVKAGTVDRVQLCLSSAVSTAYTNFYLSGSGSITGTGGALDSGIIPMSNGWYRIWMKYTATAASGAPVAMFLLQTGSESRAPSLTAAGTENFFFYGLQSELGDFLTSYIPTTNANVTRAADLCYSTSIPWFTPSQGTYYAQVKSVPNAGSLFKVYSNISDGSTSSYHSLSMNPSGPATRGEIRTLSSTEFQSDIASATTGVIKQAMAYAANDAIQCVNGTLGAADNTVTPPTGLTRLDIGNRFDGIRALGGYVQAVRFYNVRKTNTELQAMTA